MLQGRMFIFITAFLKDDTPRGRAESAPSQSTSRSKLDTSSGFNAMMLDYRNSFHSKASRSSSVNLSASQSSLMNTEVPLLKIFDDDFRSFRSIFRFWKRRRTLILSRTCSMVSLWFLNFVRKIFIWIRRNSAWSTVYGHNRQHLEGWYAAIKPKK